MKLYIATNYNYTDEFDSINNHSVGIGESPEHEEGCPPKYVYTLDSQLLVLPSYNFIAT
jgi:hypothetical protein